MEPIIVDSRISKKTQENKSYFHDKLKVEKSYDMLYRDLTIGGRDSLIYFIDGFCKDELMQKILQYFLGLGAEELPSNAVDMLKKNMPYVEVSLADKKNSR